jgi:hypothetical protein
MVSGSAQELLLMLWHRLPADGPGLRWDGDAAAGRELLATDLVP